LAWRLALASVLAVVAAAVCYLVMVRTSLGQRFDNAAYLGAKEQLPGPKAASSDALRRITGDSFALVLAGLVVLGALRRRVLLGLGAALAAGIAVVLTHFLKLDILSRPALAADVYTASNTFPSGHTATAVSCSMALVLLSPPRWRGVAAVVAGAYGWITAAQVQTAGWHRPSDAIGAAFLAFAAVTGVGAALAWARPVTWQGRGRNGLALGVLGFVGLIALVFLVRGLVNVLGYLRDHGLRVEVPGGLRHDAYITGLALTVEVVVVLLMVLLALVGTADLGAQRAPTFAR
jgi:membrane-associated phospholipid phosphatase